MLILDEMTPTCAVTLKKILQASNDDAVLGTSPTMLHAYVVNSYRTMIIITTNTWATGLLGMPKHDVEWLQMNCVYIHVVEPLWETS